MLHVVLPAISSAIFIVGIWLNVIPWPAAPMTSFPLIVLAVIVAATMWGGILRKKESPLLVQLGQVLFMQEDSVPAGKDAG